MAHDILIVDDEPDIRTLTAGILEDEGFDVREAAGSDDALATIESRRPSLVLLDIWLQGSPLDGLGILKEVKRIYPELPVVMMSGHGTIETAVAAIRLGAYDFIEKPFKADRLLLVVERAVETAVLKRENAELRLRSGTDDHIVGASPITASLRHAVKKVAATNSRVLVSGPAGSGKEVVARMMHRESRRADGPFVVVNCATIEPGHAEETLFGAEDSAPREGGVRIGMFEQAHGGTLLLDEVADMPYETQGKIVRALQEQSFVRVGGQRRVNVDVRVIASTTRDLPSEIAAGRFREDLFYRLSVVPLSVPSLASRREDIPELARYFMDRSADALGQPPRPFTDDACTTLKRYDWPGNVRELKNVVERILIMAPGENAEPVSEDMLPQELAGEVPETLRMDRSGEVMSLPIRDAREAFEREYLVTQMLRFDGNISRTANFVGMERSALHRKLKALGLQGDDKPKNN